MTIHWSRGDVYKNRTGGNAADSAQAATLCAGSRFRDGD